MGQMVACHPFKTALLIKSWYLAFFCWWDVASLSSQGTMSSVTMMFFVLLDRRTMSGWREVAATSCGKTSLLLRSTLSSQSEARCKMVGRFLAAVLFLGALSPSLTKFVASGGRACLLLALTLCCSTHLVISVRTLSCLQLYRPSANAFGQPVKMWFSVQEAAPHCLQDGSSSSPQIFRLLGVGNRSATERRRKVNFPWSVCHSSFQDSGRFCAWSHCSH